MSAEPQSSGSSATTAGVAPGHNRKSSTSPPKGTQQDASVELKNMKSERDGARGSIPLGEDIMQIARIGEVPAMQRIFDEKKLTARYKDEEGITPLHVRTCRFSKERERELCCSLSPGSVGQFADRLVVFFYYSGLRLTTNMRCASSWWTLGPM